MCIKLSHDATVAKSLLFLTCFFCEDVRMAAWTYCLFRFAGMCDAALDISGFAATEKTTCHRLWCHEHVQWLLPAAVTVLALLLKLFLSESGKQDVSREVQQAPTGKV